MLRLSVPAFASIVAATLFAAPAPGTAASTGRAGVHGEPAGAVVQPARTSIYIGSVTLMTRPFTRHDGVFTAEYQARVFPFFFFDEHGSISIDCSDALLHRLRQGKTVQFKGHAVTSDGYRRRIEGRAIPDAVDPDRGKIKVRVWVDRVELIFNTTYRLVGFGSRPA